MAKKSGAPREADPTGKREIRKLRLVNDLLLVVAVVLVLYILYPHAVALTRQPQLGNTTVGIDAPLSPAQLGAINNAPDSYFERAGQMVLNLSLPGEQLSNNTYYAPYFQISLSEPEQGEAFVYNNKQSVIYIGATSCVWCAENRWAMALALSRFGSFNSLLIGYSSLHDGDVPTLYWARNNYATNGSVTYGNSYRSSYINFFSADYDSEISGGFMFPALQNPITYFVYNSPNSTYREAMEFMNSTRAFAGTPFTLWGASLNRGADAVVLGTPMNSTENPNYPPLTFMTHKQILAQLGAFNTTFAYEEYAAADIYVAEVCASLNNTAPICSLPSIRSFEPKTGLT
jgi:hypothetical protein